MNSVNRWISLILVSVLCVAQAPAQSAASNPQQPLPSDPAALMSLAWQQNGLHGKDLKPWHVRASWQIVDNKGKPEKQGTWEEWWAGPQQWKLVVDAPEAHRTTWGTPKGEFAQGNGSPGWIESLVEGLIVRPAPVVASLAHSQLKVTQVRDHSVQLQCVAATDKPPSEALRQFCFVSGSAALRVKQTPVMETTMNSILQFQGRYLAGKIHVNRLGMPTVQIQIDQAGPMTTGEMSQLAPPPNATLSGTWISVGSGVVAGRKISGNVPEYPALARAQHIQGIVLMWALIGTDGAIHNLEVIGGPPALQKPAVDAVRTWHYQPYLLGGRPVEVETQINVIFTLSW